MAQHIDIPSAAQLSGRALFSAIRSAAADVYKLPLATRERLVDEAARISPLHALLYLGLDQSDCLERLNAALASNGPEALSWATFALAQPKHELSEPMRQRKIQLLGLVVNNAEHVSVFCVESAHQACYWLENAEPYRNAFQRWIAARNPQAQPAIPPRVIGKQAVDIGVVCQNLRKDHVLSHFVLPEVRSLRAQGHRVHLLQCEPSLELRDEFDSLVPVTTTALKFSAPGLPRLDLVFYPEPYGAIADALAHAVRLAPIQITTAITPTPIGSPVLDFELHGAEARYPGTAPVIAVPGTGITHDFPQLAPARFWENEYVLMPISEVKWSLHTLSFLNAMLDAGMLVKVAPGMAEPALTRFKDILLPRVRRPERLQVMPRLTESAFNELYEGALAMVDASPYQGMNTVIHAGRRGIPVFCWSQGRGPAAVVGRALAKAYGVLCEFADTDDLVARLRALTPESVTPQAPQFPPAWSMAVQALLQHKAIR